MDESVGSSKCPDYVTKDIQLENLGHELDLMRERVKPLQNNVENPRKRICLASSPNKEKMDDDDDYDHVKIKNFELELNTLRHELNLIREQAENVEYKIQDKSLKGLKQQVDNFAGHVPNNIIQKIKAIIEVGLVENSDEAEMVDVEENSTIVSAAQKSALENHLIIKNITKYLDLPNLLNCRRVHSLWNMQAYKTTVNYMKNYYLGFYFSHRQNCYLNDENKGTLEDFSQLFKYHQKIPITSFQFENGSMATPDMKIFLALYGHHIKDLTLDMEFSDLALPTLSKILLHDLPNLESIVFKSTPDVWDIFGAPLFPESILQLPNLKKIKVSPGSFYSQALSDILRVAVNLQEIQQIDFYHLPSIVSANKLDLITEIIINPGDTAIELELCQKLAQSKFQPTWLGFVFQNANANSYASFAQVLTQILLSHTERLESLELCPLSFLPNLRLPILKKLETIAFLGFDRDDENRMLPMGQYFHEIFPNVINVEFWLDHLKLDDVILDSLFMAGQHILSVKHLELYGPIEGDSAGIEKLATFFPNVVSLGMLGLAMDEVPKLCSIIWKSFSNMETLKLSIIIDQPTEQLSLDMDSAFTGFTVETCKDLRINSKQFSTLQVQNLRENPSILNMKKLKSLTINFEDNEDEFSLDDDTEKRSLFSHLTGAYGFKAMKLQQNCSLKVTCSPLQAPRIAPLESILSPVLSYMDTVKFSLMYKDDEDDYF